jgi:anthranilate synthase component 1
MPRWTLPTKRAAGELDEFVTRFEAEPMPLKAGDVETDLPPSPPAASNMSRADYEAMVDKAKQYIGAGDIFQVVLSQRFARTTSADPFDIYRALRVVNPSPYMFYLQAAGCMLIGSSPEILCRVQHGVVTNRPLAGTRHRGRTEAEDQALEQDLLADPKERAEHIMLVDLGRNDVGRVAQPGSVALPAVMTVERYSHVMHISSTVTGQLLEGCDGWDVLRASLPVGTVSGAPKVRAMQIIDELEPTRRGPYAGAVGYADFAGNMDMAIALRTMVVIPGDQAEQWDVHLQAGAGIVADSIPANEYTETVNKAAALAKAIDLAETAFG